MSGVRFLGVALPNRSVLASGVLGVTPASLRRVHREGAGLVTAKSVGPAPRRGHPGPVMFDWGGGLVNAVGLSNPGVEEFVTRFGEDRPGVPWTVSVFGGREQDFAALCSRLEELDYSFLELNLSCPNVEDELGSPFAFSPELTARIIRTAGEHQSRPVIAKLSPNTPELVRVARAAEAAGARALCLANTLGPGMVIDTATGYPVLSNLTGGVSGRAVLPVTVRMVYQVFEAVDIPIIATGGISTADHALQVLMAGAVLYGVGTAVYTRGLGVFREIESGVRRYLEANGMAGEELTGMAHRRGKPVFHRRWGDERAVRPGAVHPHGRTHGYAAGEGLAGEGPAHHPSAGRPLFQVRPVHRAVAGPGGLVKTLLFEREPGGRARAAAAAPSRAEPALSAAPLPGQFYMLWYPGTDQKPFSVSLCTERYLGFSFARRGPFSELLFTLQRGDPLGLLGPLGNGFSTDRDDYLLVGGGIGCAPLIHTALYLLAGGKRVSLFAGGKNMNSVRWVEELFSVDDPGRASELSELRRLWKGLDLRYCTEDASLGLAGMLTGNLDQVIDQVRPRYVLLCGPERFIHTAVAVCTRRGVPGEAGIERMMKCGVGLCGSCCVDHGGERVCVEGPVFSFEQLAGIHEFGRYRRDQSGAVTGID